MFIFILISFFCSIIIALKKALEKYFSFLEFAEDFGCYEWNPNGSSRNMQTLTRKSIEEYLNDDDNVQPPAIQLLEPDDQGFQIANNKRKKLLYTFNQGRAFNKKMEFPFY